MANGRAFLSSRKVLLFLYIFVTLCGLHKVKRSSTNHLSIEKLLFADNQITRIIKLNNGINGRTRRLTVKQRPLANSSKFISFRLVLHASFLLIMISLSGDVETNPGPDNATFNTTSTGENRTVKCLALNARSLMSLHKTNTSEETCSNMERFQNLVYSEDSDIVCVNETWLNMDIEKSEILHSGYAIFRNDRKTRGGGVLLAVKSASFKSVREVQFNYDLEITLAEITTVSNVSLLLCSCYRPPNADKNWIDSFNNFLCNVCSRHSNLVLAGDFNMPHISWNSPEKTTGVNEKAFVELLNDYFMVQLNNTTTRGDNVLDLVLTNVPELVKISDIWSPAEAEIFTDHSTIAFDLLVHPKSLPKIHRTVYDYRKGNFTALRSALESLNLSNLISNDGDINEDWRHWKNAFLATVSDHIPIKKLRGRNYVPWMNSTILHNIKKKNSLRRKLKKSPTPNDYIKEKFKHLRTSIKQMLSESRSKYINSVCADHGKNPKRFWSLFKLKSKVCNVPEKISMQINESARTYSENPADIATLFNNYFTSIFTSDPVTAADPITTDDSHFEHPLNTSVLDDVTLTPESVAAVLRNLDNDKAHGPDGIPARLLTETASQIAPSLCALFNKSLRVGVVPWDWKLANVVPVYKKGDKEYVENYRPISLLSLISKVLERCVFNSIKDHVFCQIDPRQHGFFPGKTCVTQLIEVFDKIGRQLDLGKQIDVIYLDMSKAFDKVSHKRLLLRLRDFGFGGNILRWFCSYLQDRRQQTTILGATSTPNPVTSGVPQGSILGPLLFLLYEDDLSSSVSNSNIATYADDTKIFKEISTHSDAAALQEDLENFETHSSDAGLPLNISKCKIMQITRKHNKIEYPYSLQDTILENSEQERDLGVWTSHNLTWCKQVLEQCSKANKILGFIRRTTRNIKNHSARRTLYLALVRSQLGYATQVWSPQSIDLIARLERVQRRASKYILDLPFRCAVSYNQRLMDINILPISYWHEYLDMLFFFKANCGIINLSDAVLPKRQNSNKNTRSVDPNCLQFHTKKCNTGTYQKSYTIRTTRIWNALPKPITSKYKSLTAFKKSLLEYYHSALENNYNVDDPRSWKTICVKCNQARDLTNPLSCCF